MSIMSEDYIVVSKMYLIKIDKSNEDYLCELYNFQAQVRVEVQVGHMHSDGLKEGQEDDCKCIVYRWTQNSGGGRDEEGEESVPLIRVRACL